MTELPLSVLAHEGPSARAYVEVLYRAGFRVREVILLNYQEVPGTSRRLGRWLPKGALRERYTLYRSTRMLNFWPVTLRRLYPSMVGDIASAMAAVHPESGAIIEALTGRWDWSRYTDHVRPVMVRNLSDSRLLAALQSTSPGTLLFTGGGLMPAGLLQLSGLRVLHVHPAVLPDIRGADGLLWSLLLRGRPGASVFFLAPGLDEGDLLRVAELDPVIAAGHWDRTPDLQTLYRAVFCYIDPIVRARALLECVQDTRALTDFSAARAQDPAIGETYHFMHPRLRADALRRLFPGKVP